MKTGSLSIHRTLIITACVACIVSIALYVYMYYSVNAATERAAAARTIVQEHAFNDTNAEMIQKLYDSTVEQRARILKHTMASTEIVSFIETLEAVGTEAGSTLKLSGVSSGKPKDVAPDGMGLFHAHVDGSGSWASVMQTLMLTETLPFVTMVDSVQLNNTAGTSARVAREWHISFDVTMLNTVATSSPQK